MTEGLRTVAVAFIGLAAGLSWYAFRTSTIPTSSPDRLVAELRLAQFAALLLAMTAGAYVGVAVENETRSASASTSRSRSGSWWWRRRRWSAIRASH